MDVEYFSYGYKYKSSFFYKKTKMQEAQTNQRLSFFAFFYIIIR